ncbi:coiled-coil domain-containing protein 34-like [Toxorhynchites rutilus septentrionalis]|uniref:coiled-coil domain-containing protein 34-like n=1 Tax=Toxorhynchites rutilus septentrionalis TaxID=329112 RepID=UPI00247A8D08|nr:coiled-coil domain-containing protein 34-like [Toxorhynchites rutilus septentrionalis]
MEHFQQDSAHASDEEETRCVNNAIYISKDRQLDELDYVDSSDSESIISSLTIDTLKAPLCALEEEWSSESSSSTSVPLKMTYTSKGSNSQAFEEWLKSKNETDRKRIEREKKRKSHEEARRKIEDERRKQENEQKFKQWMQRKKEEEEQRKNKQPPFDRKETEEEKPKRWIPTEESVSNFEVWLSRVEEKKRQAQLREQTKQRMDTNVKQKRQDLSAMAYDEWLKSSVSKPKPVPLNRGTESLRGTISKLYINPVPWKGNDEKSTNH